MSIDIVSLKNLYSLNQSTTKKEENKPNSQEEQLKEQPKLPQENRNSEVLDSLDFLAQQNIADISIKMPEKTNSQNAISDSVIEKIESTPQESVDRIEAMMAEFESGVNNIAEGIMQEFPGISKQQAMSIASEVYAG